MGETSRMRTANAQPISYRTGVVAALDIGSSKVTCLIGRAEPGALKVLGAALRESQGIKAATVTSIDEAEEAIREAVAAAENHADTRIQNVVISVACGSPTSVSARAAAALDGALVSDAHLHALLGEGRARCQREGYAVIQAAPTSYAVDEARGVRDPRGMFCQRIGVAMHAVAVKPSPLQNLKLAVERGHLSVAGSLFSGYASGLSTLTPDEMQLGATVIDMGGGVTSIAVFLEGQMVHADVVPMGGALVTSDLARMLAAPLSVAERIKTLYGAALGDIESGTDTVAVPQMGEDNEDYAVRVPRSMLTRIIQPRLEEILGEVQTRLRASGFDVVAGRRAVLTGGASQLAGTRELAQRVLNKQVRIGRPQTFPGLPAASAGPDYAAVLGLLMAGATMPPEALNPDRATEPQEGRGSFLRRITGGLFG
ncbi:MAG: cell division protein FtsA [Alphaproteobacteria bacterium]|nr:cell division protein FtsA [Alphaproteobacteria bacterium]MDE2012382.1 cell division protein FtsA [Alphaproteobacteria bacterium]MDE2073110.1 cell division protein FtsA [Alphaproteobacteria bacterium]MDE2353191.1 cell division protein FtsA [Alphaproteobacteria bacterium]